MSHMSDRDVSAYLDGDHYRAKRQAQRMRRKSVLPAAFVAGIFTVLAFFAGGAIAGSEISSFISPLLETLGGTHQTSYTTGDILYASGSNTLSKLGIGSTNNVLTVTGGVPAWGSGSGVSASAWYGDGSDGTVTFDGSTTILGMAPSSNVYTMTRDLTVASMTVNNGVTVVTANYRIFGTGTLTNNGTVSCNGGAGGNGAGATAGGAGSSVASAVFNLSGAGGAGGAGAGANGSAGGGVTSISGAGGRGGDAGANTGAAGGTVTAPAASSGSFHAFPAFLTGEEIVNNVHVVGGSGGGGGAGTASHGGGGGGGGGGVMLLAFKTITNNSVVSANGGAGGNGDAGTGGRGAGGGGGIVYYIYNTYSGSVPTASAGADGTGSATNATSASAGAVIAINNNQ